MRGGYPPRTPWDPPSQSLWGGSRGGPGGVQGGSPPFHGVPGGVRRGLGGSKMTSRGVPGPPLDPSGPPVDCRFRRGGRLAVYIIVSPRTKETSIYILAEKSKKKIQFYILGSSGRVQGGTPPPMGPRGVPEGSGGVQNGLPGGPGTPPDPPPDPLRTGFWPLFGLTLEPFLARPGPGNAPWERPEVPPKAALWLFWSLNSSLCSLVNNTDRSLMHPQSASRRVEEGGVPPLPWVPGGSEGPP